MTKQYKFAENFSLNGGENGQYSGLELSIAVAHIIGGKLEELKENGDAIVTMKNGQKFFVTDAKDHAGLAKRQQEYEANWFCPFTSKPIAQELLRRFPMAVSGQLFRHGALNGEWVAESNTLYAAGNPQMAGLLYGPDAWCITASENVLEAIVLNALMQAGVNREAVFYFPNGERSGQLIYVTPESAQLIKQDQQLAAVCVFCPPLDKYSVIGAPEEALEFELGNAKLAWQIQMARWSRETGQPIPEYSEPEQEDGEVAESAE